MTQAFADCLHIPCSTCGAAIGSFCTHTLNDGTTAPRHAPCHDRHVLGTKETAS